MELAWFVCACGLPTTFRDAALRARCRYQQGCQRTRSWRKITVHKCANCNGWCRGKRRVEEKIYCGSCYFDIFMKCERARALRRERRSARVSG